MKNLLKLSFYVPKSHLESVKNALFFAGAGRYKNYDCCCWTTLGEGQFRPLAKSKPYIGKLKKIKKVSEYKVEMICEKRRIKQIIEALKSSHPYEEPAFDFIVIKVK